MGVYRSFKVWHPLGMAGRGEYTPERLRGLHEGRVSRDPEIARAMGKRTGFGGTHATHRQCKATTRAGKQCRQPACYGTPVCITHGARRYKCAPESPARNRAIRGAATKAWEAPEELRRRPEWQATYSPTIGKWEGAQERAALVRAWEAMQQGDHKLWRDLTRT